MFFLSICNIYSIYKFQVCVRYAENIDMLNSFQALTNIKNYKTKKYFLFFFLTLFIFIKIITNNDT